MFDLANDSPNLPFAGLIKYDAKGPNAGCFGHQVAGERETKTILDSPMFRIWRRPNNPDQSTNKL